MIQVGHRATHDLHPTVWFPSAAAVSPAEAGTRLVVRLWSWDPPRKIFKQPTVGLCITVYNCGPCLAISTLVTDVLMVWWWYSPLHRDTRSLSSSSICNHSHHQGYRAETPACVISITSLHYLIVGMVVSRPRLPLICPASWSIHPAPSVKLHVSGHQLRVTRTGKISVAIVTSSRGTNAN